MAPSKLAARLAGVVAFVHVHVVPMDRERVLDDQTVIVRDAEIVAIGPAATTPVPAGATLVDGHGTEWLLPGLADLHVHAKAPDDLLLYVVNGVTTILNLGEAGSGFVTQTRARIATGELIAPTCFVAPLMNGQAAGELPCSTPETARASVRQAKATGYEFIKVYNDLSRACFHAICDEAHAQGLAVVGHAVRAPGLEESFEAGQVMLAHAEEYLYTILLDGRGKLDESRIPLAVDVTKRHGVFVVPNLSAYEKIAAQWGRPDVVAGDFLARPEAKWLRPWWRTNWQRGRYANEKTGALDANVGLVRRLTKALHDAGVPLLLGTDSPDIPGVYAGFAIHDDLRNLVQSGLTPFEALSCGTRVAGEFIEQCVPDAAAFGTIEIGKRADLLLLAQNPLEDVARLCDADSARGVRGVMLRGRWLPRAELDRRLAELASAHVARQRRMEQLLATAKASGLPAAIAAYLAAQKSEAAGASDWIAFDEEEVNEAGYRSLRLDQRPADAAAWFELNTKLHPDSGNAWDSCGEGQLANGDRVAAAASYRRAIALDPFNQNAARALKQLSPD